MYSIRSAVGTRLIACLLLVVFSFVPSLRAHGDLHELIENVTAEIAKNPKDAKLYVSRAELYRLHEQFDEALSDLLTAELLDPTLARVEFTRARVYVDLKMPKTARATLDRFLTREPGSVEGLIARAKVLTDLKETALAIADYSAAIAAARQPLPEYYIERARLDQLDGGGGRAAALKGLDAGIAKFGPLVTLQLPAIDLELADKNYDGAIARLDTLMAQSQRKETWLERKGQILERAGRAADAHAAYVAGLKTLGELPENIRATQMMVELKQRLEADLVRVP